MGYYLCFPRETNRPNFGCREGKSSSFFPYTGICGTSVYHKSVLTILHNHIYDRLAVRTCDDWCLCFPSSLSVPVYCHWVARVGCLCPRISRTVSLSVINLSTTPTLQWGSSWRWSSVLVRMSSS